MPTATSEDELAPGDVVVVPFPYSDRLAEKRRPALIVSNAEVLNAGFVWIAMITSASNPPMPHDLPITDLTAAGLKVASTVRTLKIACIEPARIIRRAGRLSSADAKTALATVRSLIG